MFSIFTHFKAAIYINTSTDKLGSSFGAAKVAEIGTFVGKVLRFFIE